LRAEGQGQAAARWLALAAGALMLMAVTEAGTVAAGGRRAATYYVDNDRGADENDGRQPQRAWRSLDPVNAMTFGPGDRLLFRAGTRYRGRLDLHGSGTEAKPIEVDVYGDGARPRIDAEGRFPEAVRLHNVQGWEIRGLEITNTGAERAPRRCGVSISLDNFGTARHIVLRDLYVHDVNSDNVKEQGGAGISWGAGGDKMRSRFDGLTIEKCHLVRTDRNGIVGWNDHWPRDKWYPSLHVVIRNNLLEDIGGDGIVPIGCDGCVVEHNVLRGGRARAPDYAAGIWPWSCDNTVIQFNEVSGMVGTKDGQGFDADWNCRNTIIQYNYSHDNEGGFVLICNDGSQGVPYNAGNQRPVVRYNISQNDGERTFQISAVQDALIYNNTIYVGEGREVAGIFFHDWGGWAENTLFANNIFYADGTMRWDLGGSRGTRFEHNAFYGHHENQPDDAGAITADPRLTQPGSGRDGRNTLGGYRLRGGSPCRGAGLALPDRGRRDFWGDPLPAKGPVDVGAYQGRREVPR
jgi:hypothetical protein